jgi:hypothetical protein
MGGHTAAGEQRSRQGGHQTGRGTVAEPGGRIGPGHRFGSYTPILTQNVR